MIILSQNIIIKWNANNKKYYEEKGYNYTKIGDTFKINILDLSDNSRIKVQCTCDYCNNIIFKSYNDVNLNGKIKYQYELKNCCKNCVAKKREEASIEKYGIKNPAQLKEVKENKTN